MGNIRLQIAHQILQTDFSTNGLSEVPFNLNDVFYDALQDN